MKKTSFHVVLCLGSLLLMNGCATMFLKKTQLVALTPSNQQRVIVRVNGNPVTIPGQVELPRGEDSLVSIHESDNPCLESTQYTVYGRQKMSPVFILNILNMGLLSTGPTTDLNSSNVWELETSYIIPVVIKKHCLTPNY